MKKLLFIPILLALFFSTPSVAQTIDTMPVPMGNFEQWDYHPGDTMTVMIFPLPLNAGSYLPTGWNVPEYTVNDTFSYMGFSLPINATVPFAHVWNDTVNAPQGSSALVAESFLFSDILSPIAYTLAEPMLDSNLSSIVVPSVVSTGQVDLNAILPFMERMMMNTTNYDWVLDLVDSVDINDFISGGFPLNGFEPKRIHGYYKYITSNGNDHGALLAIGTRYDTITHRRMLVGAGSKMLHQLYDTVDYEPFEMDYALLSDYYPAGYAFEDADSMVIFIVSSASDKFRAHHSRLYIDSLVLIHEADTCGRVFNFVASDVTYSTVNLSWNTTFLPNEWLLEYGESGFTLGRGTQMHLSDSSVFIYTLDPGVTYDCYVRAVCDEADGPWTYVTFTTDTMYVPPTPPEGIAPNGESDIVFYPNPAHGQCHIQFGNTAVSRIRLYTVDGRMLQDMPVTQCEYTLTLPSAGLYFVEVDTPQGPVFRKISNE